MAHGGKIEDLGRQERAVLEAIVANPMTGQKEIAASLGLARSTVAAHIVELVRKGYILGRGYLLPATSGITCIGGAAIDRKYALAGPLEFGTSNPVEGRRTFGGVARNVAENLARLAVPTSIVTIVGDDENGRALSRHLKELGIDTTGIAVSGRKPTAEYSAILGPDRDLVFGLADMGIFDLVETAEVERMGPHIAASSWVFADCNLPAEVLRAIIARRQGAGFKLAIGAVSTPKMAHLPTTLAGIDLLFLNLDEALAWLGHGSRHPMLGPDEAARALIAAGCGSIVLTRGAAGFVAAMGPALRNYPAPPSSVVDVTGAGDALIAGTLYRLRSGEDLFSAVRTGSVLAAVTTETEETVYPQLSPRVLEALLPRLVQARSEPEVVTS